LELFGIKNEAEVSQAYLEAVELQQEDHSKFNVNLAWQQLNEHYERLNNRPVYAANSVLHLRHKDAP
jgi:hypothetical protein